MARGLVSLALSMLTFCFALTPAHAQATRDETFDALWTVVGESFLDPQMNGVDWSAVRAEYRPRVAAARDEAAFAALMNEMLARLRTSHTAYYGPDDPMLAILLDVFSAVPDLAVLRERFGPDGPQLTGIGVFTRRVDGRTFADLVLSGGAAARAGLRAGDEIVTVDGAPFDAATSFAGKQSVSVAYRRARGGRVRTVTVPVTQGRGLAVLNEASRASVQSIARDGRTIAYVRMWSLVGDAPGAILAQMPLAQADALVLDIRGVVGGGGVQLLDQLDARVGVLCSTPRGGAEGCAPRSFRGRTVLLTDEHSRSGAELLASGFRRNAFGVIVGANTAGAVSAGRLYALPNGGAAYVAVTRISVDGAVLEGVGVAPDAPVTQALPYSAGADAQYDAALRVAACLAEGTGAASCAAAAR